MTSQSIDLDAIAHDVLQLLEEQFNLDPIKWSVNMVLTVEHFDSKVANHPDAITPDLLTKTVITSDPWRQWAVQIGRQHIIDNVFGRTIRR